MASVIAGCYTAKATVAAAADAAASTAAAWASTNTV